MPWQLRVYAWLWVYVSHVITAHAQWMLQWSRATAAWLGPETTCRWRLHQPSFQLVPITAALVAQGLLAAGAVPALMALVSTGSDKCREAAADALAALGDVAARDPAQRELLKLKVLPVLLQLLHTSTHDGTRVSAVAAVKTLTWPPANTDFRCRHNSAPLARP